MLQLLRITLASTLLATCTIAQQYPLPVTYDAIIQSPVNPSITISYKQPDPKTCVTAFNTQKQYSGYINLPPFTLAPYQQNYSINTFFWFVESRENPDTAPLVIWLNGGPVSSSMTGLFLEMGPCEIIQPPNGTYGTQPRLWGWDRSSNLLFIDQPTQVGFSYDEHINASIDFKEADPFGPSSRKRPSSLPVGVPPWRSMNGTFSSGNLDNTEDLTPIAARACWHFLQGFLSAFPQYNPGTRLDDTIVNPTDVHLFAESYGGFYGPTFADFFEDQNDRRKNGTIPASSLDIRLGSVGIVNGMIDVLTSTIATVDFTHQNTYNVEKTDLVTFQNAISEINSADGCRALVTRCCEKVTMTDREGFGDDQDTNNICSEAIAACYEVSARGFYTRNPYDIRVNSDVSYSAAYQEYLNTAEVLQSIGSPVNFTQKSTTVYNAFSRNGDAARGTQLSSLANLLVRGVRVALIYGDADIICNWYGGQNASLELAHLLPDYNTTFSTAGYADIVVNDSYIGGQVRQYGNLSFARIYDAGHLVPYYQPETAYTVFTRIVQGRRIDLGNDTDLSTFSTQGPLASNYSNSLPKPPTSFCWLRDQSSCASEERAAIAEGKGRVEAGIWLPDESTRTIASRNSPTISELKTQGTTSTIPLTGVFVATSIPTVTKTSEASRIRFPFRLRRQVTPVSTVLQTSGEDCDEGNGVRNGLIGGMAGTWALLLSLLTTLCCCRCFRSRKGIAHPDESEKGPIIITPVLDTEPVAPSIYSTRLDPIPEVTPRPSEDDVPTPPARVPTPMGGSTQESTPQIPSVVPLQPSPPPTPQEPQALPHPSDPASKSKPSLFARIKTGFFPKGHDATMPVEKADDASDRSLTPPPRVSRRVSEFQAPIASIPVS